MTIPQSDGQVLSATVAHPAILASSFSAQGGLMTMSSASAVALQAYLFAGQLVHAEDTTVNYPKVGVVRTTETYKTVGDVELKAHIFQIVFPGHAPVPEGRTAIVFFFGGGWKSGTAVHFQPHSQYFATRNVVAITPEYRIYDKHKSTVFQCVEDAKSAIRWVRRNAKRLGIDPNKVVAGGGSAGGHLAAALATLPDEPGEGRKVSYAPNALLLFNPVLDMRHEAFKIAKDSENYRALLRDLGQLRKSSPRPCTFRRKLRQRSFFTARTTQTYRISKRRPLRRSGRNMRV